MKNLNIILAKSKELQETYLPIILRLNEPNDRKTYTMLIEKGKVSFAYDEIYGQLQELIKINYPFVKITNNEYHELINKHLNGININDYGVWVYYPWDQKLVHMLDEFEFIKVRTNRNQNKITKDEQEILKTKKIGIVGLSVGHSVALTMATERICGELRLADFDIVELSNLNRLRTGARNLGLKKVVVAAREISEIDPFINVKIYEEGLNNCNITDFFTKNGCIDILVEVCDSLDMKLQSRYKARDLKTCVLMDTNDRGMLDIERFDLEPQRDILHGLIGKSTVIISDDLSHEEKLNYIYKILDVNNISSKLKSSITEIGKSLNAWPQLASSTTLGGALTTDISRKILLKEHHKSGRYYIDFDELIPT